MRMTEAEYEDYQAKLEARQNSARSQAAAIARHSSPNLVVRPRSTMLCEDLARMNKTERDYAARYLIDNPGVLRWDFEAVNFRLAKSLWYRPDFLVLTAGEIQFHEIKGPRVWEDGWVKFKQARELFPWAHWQYWQRIEGVWNRKV